MACIGWTNLIPGQPVKATLNLLHILMVQSGPEPVNPQTDIFGFIVTKTLCKCRINLKIKRSPLWG